VAQIGVRDGILQRLCGCNEAAGEFQAPEVPLVCTVPAGTTVFFQFITTRLRHQIVSIGQPAFPPSPVSDPAGTQKVNSYAVVVTPAGTYAYEDNYDNALSGQIVAQ
jgi:plastocyanin